MAMWGSTSLLAVAAFFIVVSSCSAFMIIHALPPPALLPTMRTTGTSAPPPPTRTRVSLSSEPSPSATAADQNNNQNSSESAPPPPPTATTYVRCGKCETIYALSEDDFLSVASGGRGGGRRLECSVCSHSWFQTKDRLMTLKEGYEMIPLPQHDLERIAANIQQGKEPKFVGDTKLYVGNIAFECAEDDLFQAFSQVGEVGDVTLIRDENGRNRGFGFVTMRNQEEGQRAIATLDGTSLRGRNLAVRESTS